VKLEPLADSLFAVTVRVGSVPVGATKFPGPVEELEALFVGSSEVEKVRILIISLWNRKLVLGCSISDAETHQAETNGRDSRPISAELAGRRIRWGHVVWEM
jgi:hypothetical protein